MKIDFFVLSSETTQNKADLFACQLVEKYFRPEQKLYIHTDTKEIAERINQLLWVYRDDSFLPHNLVEEKSEPTPPIQIGYTQYQIEHPETILMNLSTDVPDFYQQFSHILEIVFPDPTRQQYARDHYRRYRKDGFEITTHNIN